MEKHQNKKPLFSVTKKDCRWDYYVGSGKGGQKRNKTANCVRCTHVDSGAVGKSEEGRSQSKNKRAAFIRMSETPKFKAWIRLEKAKKLGVEARIEKEMKKTMLPHNLRIETKDKNGRWVEENGKVVKEK